MQYIFFTKQVYDFSFEFRFKNSITISQFICDFYSNITQLEN